MPTPYLSLTPVYVEIVGQYTHGRLRGPDSPNRPVSYSPDGVSLHPTPPDGYVLIPEASLHMPGDVILMRAGDIDEIIPRDEFERTHAPLAKPYNSEALRAWAAGPGEAPVEPPTPTE